MNLTKMTERQLPALADHPEKLARKVKDYVLGWIFVLIGVALAGVGCAVALKTQSVILSLSFVGGGLFVGFYGSNIISREVSRAARHGALEALEGVTSSLGGLLPGRRKSPPKDE